MEMDPANVVEVLRPPTLQIVVPVALLEPNKTVCGPPINSPILIVPPLRLARVITFPLVPRLKLALALPKLYDVVPLLNRKVPWEIRPPLLFWATIILPVKLFMVEPAAEPPIVRVEVGTSRLVMITVPLPDQGPFNDGEPVMLFKSSMEAPVKYNGTEMVRAVAEGRRRIPPLFVMAPVPKLEAIPTCTTPPLISVPPV